MSKITKTTVDDLDRHPAKEYFVWDDDIHGLGIRIMPSGCASYFIQYRTPEGKTRRLTIGKVGTLTPNTARDLGRAKLIEVAVGRDPSRARHDARETLDVSEVCDLYLKAAEAGLVLTRFRTPKRPSTIENDRSRIARHIKPLIGSIPVTKLARADVQRMADGVAAGRTNGVFKTKRRGKGIVKGGSFSASRVVQMFGGIWTWAERRGYVTGVNPTRGVETARATPRDRVLLTHELQALGENFARLADVSARGDHGGPPFRLHRLPQGGNHRPQVDAGRVREPLRSPPEHQERPDCPSAGQAGARHPFRSESQSRPSQSQ
jgi:hypothetical protein